MYIFKIAWLVRGTGRTEWKPAYLLCHNPPVLSGAKGNVYLKSHLYMLLSQLDMTSECKKAGWCRHYLPQGETVGCLSSHQPQSLSHIWHQTNVSEMNDIHLLDGTQNQINWETKVGRWGHRGNVETLFNGYCVHFSPCNWRKIILILQNTANTCVISSKSI